MSLKSTFNWLARHSFKDGIGLPYTLDGVGYRALRLLGAPATVCKPDIFNHAGRIAERGVTLSGLFYAVTTGLAVGGPIGAAAGLGIAVAGKAAGLAAGGLVHLAAKAIDMKLSPETPRP